MKVIYHRRMKNRIAGMSLAEGEAVEVECRSAFVRDGVLTMVNTVNGETIEHGIPVDMLAEYQIVKPAELSEADRAANDAARQRALLSEGFATDPRLPGALRG